MQEFPRFKSNYLNLLPLLRAGHDLLEKCNATGLVAYSYYSGPLVFLPLKLGTFYGVFGELTDLNLVGP